MKLVQNARAIALKSFSMWSMYLGIALLVLPELLFWGWSIELNPRLTWGGGLALIVFGALGRIVDQGIDRDTMKCAGATTAAAFLLVALPLIADWEGKRNAAYLDIVGVPTICFGHTDGVRLGDYKTDAECEDLLRAEVLEYRDGLHGYFSADTIKTRLPSERDAAFVSLAYNVGIGGAGRSTATRRLNAGNITGACTALTWWNKAGGRVIRGLVRRRAAEYDLCMKGVA